MNNMFTCPYCDRRYRISKPGNYICDCGVSFNYPEILSTISRNHSLAKSDFIDSSSRSVRKFSVYNLCSTRKMRYIAKEESFMAKASFLCGILGLVFFGLLSLPALFIGIAAREKIADRKNKMTGMWMANFGILAGIAGCIIWGTVYLIS